jgi:hypothetical protein
VLQKSQYFTKRVRPFIFPDIFLIAVVAARSLIATKTALATHSSDANGAQVESDAVNGAWHCPVLLTIAVLTLAGAYSAQGQDADTTRANEVRENFQRVNSMANALYASINQIGETRSRITEAAGKAEVAGSVDAGRDVVAYVLYRQTHLGDETHEFVDSVSPHPFPQFLMAAGTLYRVEETHVVGNGAYRKLGLQPYPDVEDFRPIYPNDPPVMRAAADDDERSQLYQQWNGYRSEALKREYSPPSAGMRPELQTAVSEPKLVDWDVPTEGQRAAILALESKLEKVLDDQIDDFNINISITTENAELWKLQHDQEAMLERLQLLHGYLDGISELGSSFGLMGDSSSYHRELHNLSLQLDARIISYQDAVALQSEAQRLDKQRRDIRLAAAKRMAWDHLVAVVGTACADPAQAAATTPSGYITGVSNDDFPEFISEDTDTRDKLTGIDLGRAFSRLSYCQEAILRSLEYDLDDIISVSEVVTLARKYHLENPTLFDMIGNFFSALTPTSGSNSDSSDVGGDGSSDSGSSRSTSNNRSGATDAQREQWQAGMANQDRAEQEIANKVHEVHSGAGNKSWDGNSSSKVTGQR